MGTRVLKNDKKKVLKHFQLLIIKQTFWIAYISINNNPHTEYTEKNDE